MLATWITYWILEIRLFFLCKWHQHILHLFDYLQYLLLLFVWGPTGMIILISWISRYNHTFNTIILWRGLSPCKGKGCGVVVNDLTALTAPPWLGKIAQRLHQSHGVCTRHWRGDPPTVEKTLEVGFLSPIWLMAAAEVQFLYCPRFPCLLWCRCCNELMFVYTPT